MRHNLNVLPEGFELPKTVLGPEGTEAPLHVAQGTVDGDGDEVIYKVLCKSGRYVQIPESALVKIEAAAP